VDALRQHLRAIGSASLLGATGELELARRIERGDLAAKRALIEANLRLVVSIGRLIRIPANITDASTPLVSLDTPISSHATLRDVLPDEAAEPTFDHVDRELRSQALWRGLSRLAPLEREAFRLRFGLAGAQQATRMQAARALALSPEHVHRLELLALRKLERLPHTQPLREAA